MEGRRETHTVSLLPGKLFLHCAITGESVLRRVSHGECWGGDEQICHRVRAANAAHGHNASGAVG